MTYERREPPRVSTITPLLLTRNEAPNVGRALENLKWARRIVVVDSHSTDDTLAIMQNYPAVQVFQRKFDRHHDQWNFGLEQIDSEWVLTLDADYILPDTFAADLRELPSEMDGYFARFTYCVFGKPLHASLYPSRCVLFRTSNGRYIQDGHTQRLELNGKAGSLKMRIYHDDRKSFEQWLEAQRRYALAEAEKLNAATAAPVGAADRLRMRYLTPFFMPFYCLIGKGLILDGKAGFYYTLQRTYAELLLALRLLDRRIRPNSRPRAEPVTDAARPERA